MNLLVAAHRRVHRRRHVINVAVVVIVTVLTLYPRSAEAQEGTRHIRNGYSFMCMAIRAATAGPGAPVFQHDCVSDWIDQRWYLHRTSSAPYTAYRFYNAFDPNLGLTSSSGNAIVEPYPGPLYELRPVEWRYGNFFQLRRQYTDRCLAIWHNFDNGAPVFETQCNEWYRDQHWYWWN